MAPARPDDGDVPSPDDSDAEEARRSSRRRFLAATAWTVPVIMVATAAPAAAASNQVIQFTADPCLHKGGSDSPFKSDVHYDLFIRNTTGATVHVFIKKVKVGRTPGDAEDRNFSTGAGIPPTTQQTIDFTIPNGGATKILHAHKGDSGNTSLYSEIHYTFGSADGVGGTAVNSVPMLAACPNEQ